MAGKKTRHFSECKTRYHNTNAGTFCGPVRMGLVKKRCKDRSSAHETINSLAVYTPLMDFSQHFWQYLRTAPQTISITIITTAAATREGVIFDNVKK
ncbi:hypothetical protein CHS0354_009518 [Potamilus streckersoni]|uniref:Uncharacterized protein n=1 Tax=Potamilus streckersoni TaxID=2493646 RepID=A0AAE0W035_9BIVA|nr:hypothetical protein CHS0354_009518 [Potamilus streckersoni]